MYAECKKKFFRVTVVVSLGVVFFYTTNTIATNSSQLLVTGLDKREQIIVKIMRPDELNKLWGVEEKIEHTGTDAWVQKVTDGKKIYIIKQINDDSSDEQFLLINDTVASTIGCVAGIPVNSVSFIPYTVGQHLKKYPDRAATLHTYVNGQDLESVWPAFLPESFILQQKIINPNSPWQREKPLAVNEQGVTRTIIESMSINGAFPLLCALDTFVGNSDRSQPNIIYNSAANSFYGIDHAAAFARKLPPLACDRIKELIAEGYFDNCAPEVIEGLSLYRDNLEKLCQITTTFDLASMLSDLAPLLFENAEQVEDIGDRVRFHSKVFKCNRESTIELIALLDPMVKPTRF